MSRSHAYIVFSDDWGEHPSSCQHLFGRIAIDSDVLWVNTVGMRHPRLDLADLHKAIAKVSRMLGRRGARRQPGRTPPARLEVVQPFMLPWMASAVVRAINRRSVRRSLADWQRRHSDDVIVVVSTVPNASDNVADLNADRVVYYCVDDFAQWPGLESGLVRRMEKDLVSRSDLIIGTAQKLCDQLADSGKPVHLLTHGVDLQHFGRRSPVVHADVARLPRPRFGYFGVLDERTNQALLAGVAAAMPDCSFVIVGRISVDTALLAARPNVHFTGPVAYDELPAVVAGLDALLLPYEVNEFTATISPLKLKEYLATGLPVVSTPLQEVLRQPAEISIAADVSGWHQALEQARSVDVDARRVRCAELLAEESWQRKAARFVQMCTS